MSSLTLILGVCILFTAGCLDGNLVSKPAERAGDRARYASAAAANDADATGGRRDVGQARLDSVLAANVGLVRDMRSGVMPLDDPRAMNLRTAIDSVAKQRDAYASDLFWYTDLDAAKAEAARTGRHILSLRLLGNLDEEYSCANSRFFRTVLYANSEVSKHLREHYVLHWKSVRPAPLVTIDMGDGRRIKRTITGNSIHYILDADGTVLDAIPGLYGPRAFVAALERSEKLSGRNPEALRSWHGIQADMLRRAWLLDAVRTGMYGSEMQGRLLKGELTDLSQWMITAFPERQFPLVQKSKRAPETHRKPTEFEPLAGAKSMVERPISQKTSPSTAPAAAESESLEEITPELRLKPLLPRMSMAWWEKFAQNRLESSRLDRSSRQMMIAKLPRDSVRADERATGGVVDGKTPFARTLRRFESAIALDTVRNEYLFHIQIHQWLEEDETDRLRGDVETLNKRVYSELFLTPDYDAWLGLVPDDTYTALEKDGCACDKGAPPMR